MKRIRETSVESYKKIDHPTRKLQILHVLSDGVPRTAIQCSQALGKDERNYTHPRLSALVEAGMVDVLNEKAWDDETKRHVSIYQISNVGRRWLAILEGGSCPTGS